MKPCSVTHRNTLKRNIKGCTIKKTTVRKKFKRLIRASVSDVICFYCHRWSFMICAFQVAHQTSSWFWISSGKLGLQLTVNYIPVKHHTHAPPEALFISCLFLHLSSKASLISSEPHLRLFSHQKPVSLSTWKPVFRELLVIWLHRAFCFNS